MFPKKTMLNKLDITEKNVAFFTQALDDFSYRNKEIALKKLTAYNPDFLYQDIDRNVNGENDFGRKLAISKLGLLLDYGLNKDSVMAVEQLIEYTSSSYEFLTRVNAIKLLKNKKIYNDILVANLLDAIYNPNKRLSMPAKKYLKQLYELENVKSILVNERQKQLFDWQIKILSTIK